MNDIVPVEIPGAFPSAWQRELDRRLPGCVPASFSSCPVHTQTPLDAVLTGWTGERERTPQTDWGLNEGSIEIRPFAVVRRVRGITVRGRVSRLGRLFRNDDDDDDGETGAEDEERERAAGTDRARASASRFVSWIYRAEVVEHAGMSADGLAGRRPGGVRQRATSYRCVLSARAVQERKIRVRISNRSGRRQREFPVLRGHSSACLPRVHQRSRLDGFLNARRSSCRRRSDSAIANP